MTFKYGEGLISNDILYIANQALNLMSKLDLELKKIKINDISDLFDKKFSKKTKIKAYELLFSSEFYPPTFDLIEKTKLLFRMKLKNYGQKEEFERRLALEKENSDIIDVITDMMYYEQVGSFGAYMGINYLVKSTPVNIQGALKTSFDPLFNFKIDKVMKWSFESFFNISYISLTLGYMCSGEEKYLLPVNKSIFKNLFQQKIELDLPDTNFKISSADYITALTLLTGKTEAIQTIKIEQHKNNIKFYVPYDKEENLKPQERIMTLRGGTMPKKEGLFYTFSVPTYS